MRIASWVAPISMLKIATGTPFSTATCSAMLSANAVLPIDGRPATMTRSPGCRPAVFSSRSMKPVGTPVTSDLFSWWYRWSMRSNTRASTGWICLEALRAALALLADLEDARLGLVQQLADFLARAG